MVPVTTWIPEGNKLATAHDTLLKSRRSIVARWPQACPQAEAPKRALKQRPSSVPHAEMGEVGRGLERFQAPEEFAPKVCHQMGFISVGGPSPHSLFVNDLSMASYFKKCSSRMLVEIG
jgi:hypothetical protein